jgi:beta-glucosidase
MRPLPLLATAIALSATPAGAAPTGQPWMAPGLSPDARADLVVKAATPQELKALIQGSMLFFMAAKDKPVGITPGSGYVPGIPRLGIPPMIETDASLGVANLGGVMRMGDVATAMPSSLAVAASFDPSVAHEGGAMIGSEAKAKGFNVMLAGGVNLTRDPRGGRNFEYAGEDPLLAGRMAGAQIAGVQSNGIVSTIKHFALNDQETGRTAYSVEMPEADMRESDLLAFRIAIESGHPGSVMCSYNRVGGVYACENPFLLTKVLRADWHWPGWVMSDWGAVHSSEALTAGLDQQSAARLDRQPWFGAPLDAKIASGAIPQSAVTTAARRILRTLFAQNVVGVDWTQHTTIDYASHGDVARRAAAAGIVLLKNDRNLLPIAKTARHIVVIGGHADVGVLAGGGSSQVSPVGGPALSLKIPGMTGMMAMVSKTIYDPSSPLQALQAALPQAAITYVDGTDPAAAAAASASADLVLVFATREASEGKDTPDLALGDGQDELIAHVAAANPKTVVVLETGNPVLMPWRDTVGGIVEAWYSGQKGGDAIADVLTGTVNPTGRLPITFPAGIDQLPNPKIAGADIPVAPQQALSAGMAPVEMAAFPLRYPEGADVGYRWYDAHHQDPLFPFGFGLSYTHFRISGLVVTGGGSPKASFTVTNVGTRAGTDIPQVYMRSAGAKRLVGWQKLALAPGESRRVTIESELRIIAHWDGAKHAYGIKPGRYIFEVGESAADVAASAPVTLAAQTLAP